MKQEEISTEEDFPKYIATHRGYRVFQARDGWHEAYRASGHAAAGGPKKRPKNDAWNGTSSKRIILPSADYAKALELLDAALKKGKKQEDDEA